MQCICKRRLISVGSSLVLIFYVTFECVATFVKNFSVIGSFCILVSPSCSLNMFHSWNMLSASFLCIGWIGFLSGDFPLVKKEKEKEKENCSCHSRNVSVARPKSVKEAIARTTLTTRRQLDMPR